MRAGLMIVDGKLGTGTMFDVPLGAVGSCFALIENWHPVIRVLVCRFGSIGLAPFPLCAPGRPARSHVYVTVGRPLAFFLVDLPVVKAQPRGAAQALMAANRASRDSNLPSGGRQSAGNSLVLIFGSILR